MATTIYPKRNKRTMGGIYHICPFCDASLDPGERCSCMFVRDTTNLQSDKIERRENKNERIKNSGN